MKPPRLFLAPGRVHAVHHFSLAIPTASWTLVRTGKNLLVANTDSGTVSLVDLATRQFARGNPCWRKAGGSYLDRYWPHLQQRP
jgi:hypothetical protein